jgi:(p)ppGpp synthase/HD superfamily hydrolase
MIFNNDIMIQDIRSFACAYHEKPSGSQRYGSEPYGKHLDDVARIVKKYLYYLDEKYHKDMLAAAYCHDLIEDTEVSARILEQRTNKLVTDIVFAVTNERGKNRKERNFKTYPKIWGNDLAIFLKICDRIANTQNSKKNNHPMYSVYKAEYPVFRYALKIKNLYLDMWNELDELNEY